MLNVAIDSKLRVADIHLGDSVRLRTTIAQQKTGRPCRSNSPSRHGTL